ncbi:MAG: hypothetical protein SOR95_10455 [Sutterella sp.]|nr:hypothetical protein [Sutterella sp.]
MPDQLICPWLVPQAPTVFQTIFESYGQRQTIGPRRCIQSDLEPYRHARLITSGVVSQAVTNHRLNKAVALNLYPAGSFLGVINLSTGVNSPRILNTVTTTELISLESRTLRELIYADKALVIALLEYMELVAKSELIGMEALFSLSVPERVLLWFASSILYFGGELLESTQEYLPLPFTVSRSVLCNIVYTTRTPLDKVLADMTKAKVIVTHVNAKLVRRKDLLEITDWILSR